MLVIDGVPSFITLELPFLANKPQVSCVPEGKYRCVKEYSPKLAAETFELKDVPGRSEIKFHWGNHPSDSQGCILIGYRLVPKTPFYILDSKSAWEDFMEIFSKDSEIDLFIRHV